jgi:hypothetical protein
VRARLEDFDTVVSPGLEASITTVFAAHVRGSFSQRLLKLWRQRRTDFSIRDNMASTRPAKAVNQSIGSRY